MESREIQGGPAKSGKGAYLPLIIESSLALNSDPDPIRFAYPGHLLVTYLEERTSKVIILGEHGPSFRHLISLHLTKK